VAYNFSTATWVNFKLFGSLGLMLVFTLAQGWYLSKHVIDEAAPPLSPGQPPAAKPEEQS
jgi:intracellular septation protein